MAPSTPDDIKKTYDEAMNHVKHRRFDAALQLFESIIEANPRIAEVHFQVGRIAIETFRAPLAIRPFRSAARLKPAEASIWAAWSDAVALGGARADEAEFLDALKQAPIAAAQKIMLQDRYGARRSSSRRATSGLAEQETNALLALMKEQRYGEAEARARKLLAQFPKFAFAANILGGAVALQGRGQEAITHFAKAIELDPAYAEAHDNLGRVLMERKQLDAAIPHLVKAVTLCPYMGNAVINLSSCLAQTGRASAGAVALERLIEDSPDVFNYRMALGNAHTRARNYQRAEVQLQRAVELAGGRSAEAFGMLAQAQARQGKDAVALENYEHALAINPDSPIATGGKAQAFQTLGRFDEANALFQRAFDIDPTNGENYRSYIAMHRTLPDDPIVDRMLAVLARPDLGDTDRMNVAFALSKVYEDLKQDDRVFAYLDQANALMRKIFPFDIASRLGEVKGLIESFRMIDWRSRAVAGATDYAPIFVTGLPRSGTTLVEQIISSHPRVTGAGEVGKATQMAQKLMTAGNGTRAATDITDAEIVDLGRQYEAYMQERFPQTDIISDKSIQTYMYIGLMKLALPNARFVVVQRDPRDTLLSMFKNKFPDGTHLYAYDQRDLAATYATFVDIVDFWRSVIPDAFVEVSYEQLVADPEAETRKLIAACGLEWDDACLKPQENTRKVETLSLYQVRQPISKASVKGWRRFEKDLKPMLDALREGGYVTD